MGEAKVTKKKDWEQICRELSSPESSDAEDVPNYKSVMKHTRRNFALAESILGKSGNSLPKFMGKAGDLDQITTSFPKPLASPPSLPSNAPSSSSPGQTGGDGA
jgi:hypothetical protein